MWCLFENYITLKEVDFQLLILMTPEVVRSVSLPAATINMNSPRYHLLRHISDIPQLYFRFVPPQLYFRFVPPQLYFLFVPPQLYFLFVPPQLYFQCERTAQYTTNQFRSGNRGSQKEFNPTPIMGSCWGQDGSSAGMVSATEVSRNATSELVITPSYFNFYETAVRKIISTQPYYRWSC